MSVTINGSNTPTAGGVTYGDGTTYATTSAGTSGQALLSAGSSAPTWGTPASATTATNLAGGSAGTVPYQSAAGTTAMLAAGTSGQLLQSNGASAPSWVAAPSSSLVLLSVVNASGASTVDLETGFGTTYANYLVVFNNVSFSNGFNYTNFVARLKLGGTYQTANYLWTYVSSGTSTPNGTGSTSDPYIQMSTGAIATVSNVANSTLGGVVYIQGATNNSARKNINYELSFTQQNGSSYTRVTGAGSNTATTDLSGIRFLSTDPVSGSITGSFRLYGFVNS